MSAARARERVLAVLRVAASLADRASPLHAEAVRELEATVTLSREGVELALERHLETRASDDELARLVASVTPVARCWVVVSAHVCTGALRALALAVAAAPEVLVKPSRRDPVVARLVVRELSRDPAFAAAGGSVALVADLSPRPGDAVHAYGSDETMAALARALPEGVLLWAHGAGLGIVFVGAPVELGPSAEAVTDDVVPFDQAGCLSPRIVLVEGEASRAEAFAEALFRALEDRGRRVPRGAVARDELARFVATCDALGSARVGEHAVVGLDAEPERPHLPPPARAVLVVPVASLAAALDYLEPLARWITTVGAAPLGPCAPLLAARLPGARVVPLGSMQRPPLDGPVDRRPPRS